MRTAEIKVTEKNNKMSFYQDTSDAIEAEIDELDKEWIKAEDQVLIIMELIRDREKMKNEKILKQEQKLLRKIKKMEKLLRKQRGLVEKKLSMSTLSREINASDEEEDKL